MNRVLTCLLFICFFTNCKKVVEEVQETKAMDFITKGQWKVTNLTKNGTIYTNDFISYVFQFNTNGKVDAVKNGATEISGDWEGNITTGVIKSNFPGQASQVLRLLNGSWQITDGGNTFVVAVKSENGEGSTLKLEKV